MKKKNLVLLIMLASVLLLFAQNNNHPQKPTAEQIMEGLTSRLNLSNEQQENISPLVDKQIALMESQGDRGRTQEKSDRTAFKQEMDKVNQQISKLLTKDQQKEYKLMLEEMHKKRGAGPGNRN